MDRPEEVSGVALETLFLQSFRAVNDYYDLQYKLHYWRTRSGLEVDFVLYGEKGLLAFEVKLSRHLSRHDLKALLAFKEEYPMAKAHIIYGGITKKYFDGITAWPIKEALQALPPICILLYLS